MKNFTWILMYLYEMKMKRSKKIHKNIKKIQTSFLTLHEIIITLSFPSWIYFLLLVWVCSAQHAKICLVKNAREIVNCEWNKYFVSESIFYIVQFSCLVYIRNDVGCVVLFNSDEHVYCDTSKANVKSLIAFDSKLLQIQYFYFL